MTGGTDDPSPDHCVLCGRRVSDKEKDSCLAHAGRFGGRILCGEHQRRFSPCGAIRSGGRW